MEPLTTITLHFPFIDDGTRRILQSTMDEAYNYGDFVEKLVNRICTEETTESAVYFAVFHSAYLNDTEKLDRIGKKFGKLPIVRPILFIHSAIQGKSEHLEEAIEAAEKVLSNNPPVWLKMEMLIKKLQAEVLSYPRTLYGNNTLETIEMMLDQFGELDFYRIRVFNQLCHRLLRDGNVEEADNLVLKAIRLAETIDDQYWMSRFYRKYAHSIQSYNLSLAEEFLQKAREILEILGDTDGIIYVLQDMCKVLAIRGEYDQAIKTCHKQVTIAQRHGIQTGVASLVLSTLYNVVGNPEASIEWAKMAEIEVLPIHRPRVKLNQAWSLALMGKIDDAFQEISSNREAILKSGLESHLAGLYLVSGICESVIGNHDEAIYSIQNALEIYERRNTLMSVFISLVQLARIDLDRALAEPLGEIGPWIDIVEERGKSLRCYGIVAQTLYLKIRWLLFQGKDRDARPVVSQFRTLVKEHSLTYLLPYLEQLDA